MPKTIFVVETLAMPEGELTNDEEQNFIEQVMLEPEDDFVRLVYADWLDEHGDPRGEYLRVEVELRRRVIRQNTESDRDNAPDSEIERLSEHIRGITGAISQEWLRLVARVPVENCSLTFGFTCPGEWGNLTVLPNRSDVRHCDACRKDVYYCTDLRTAKARAVVGQCVCVAVETKRTPGDLQKSTEGNPDAGPGLLWGFPLTSSDLNSSEMDANEP